MASQGEAIMEATATEVAASITPEAQSETATTKVPISDDPFKNRKSRVEVLVVDTAALIKGTRLDEFSDKMVTIREVVDEVRDRRARQALELIPFELTFREPSDEAIHAVSEFAKKTGDYRSLSTTDLKVLALAYMMEKEIVGSVAHLRTEPIRKGVQVKGGGAMRKENKTAAGILMASSTKATKSTPKPSTSTVPTTITPAHIHQETVCEEEKVVEEPTVEEVQKVEEPVATPVESLSEAVKDMSLEGHDVSGTQSEKTSTTTPDNAPKKEKGNNADLKKYGWGSFDVEADDPNSWITPENFKAMNKNQFDPFGDTVVDKKVKVACLTTDFAMQNVLIQMGLHVVSIDGMLIRRAKTFVLKCQACFTVTKHMEKQFCPSCGNATLFKVAVSIDKKGVTHYITRANTKLNLRGTKFSIPAPQSGRNAHNLILREDQKEYQRALKQKKDKAYDVFDQEFNTATPFKDKYQH
eukprot:Ihof_evm2s286 gene=Ihof_evmTU2s286